MMSPNIAQFLKIPQIPLINIIKIIPTSKKLFQNFLILISFSIFNLLSAFNWKEWEDPLSGKYFDFSLLERPIDNPWIHKKISGGFTIVHKFNFGQLVSKNCFGRTGSIIESYEIPGRNSASCTVLGHYKERKVDFIDKMNLEKGVFFSYKSHEPCMNPYNSNMNNYRKVKFFLHCAEHQDENVYYKS